MALVPGRWSGVQPDPEVLELAETVLRAVKAGHVRSLGVVMVDPLLKVQTKDAGNEKDDTGVRQRILATGLIQLGNNLLK